MSRSENSEYCPADDVRPLVQEVVTHLRRRGVKAADAVVDAASALGLPRRSAQALHWGEALAGRGLDVRAVRARFLAHLDHEAELLEREAATLRARRQDMEARNDLLLRHFDAGADCSVPHAQPRAPA